MGIRARGRVMACHLYSIIFNCRSAVIGDLVNVIPSLFTHQHCLESQYLNINYHTTMYSTVHQTDTPPNVTSGKNHITVFYASFQVRFGSSPKDQGGRGGGYLFLCVISLTKFNRV